jgi:hypothetical protein
VSRIYPIIDIQRLVRLPSMKEELYLSSDSIKYCEASLKIKLNRFRTNSVSESKNKGNKRKYQRRLSIPLGFKQSDYLYQFVSKMVFIIFWQGCHGFSEDEGIMSNEKIHHHHHHNSLISASPEFTQYIKYILETLQISYSTSLLSLLYLQRLRSKVGHLFYGVNNNNNYNYNNNNYYYSPGESKIPYRRDTKLEYRIFTISLILSNKYLDDSSYSNKVWSDVSGLDMKKINIMEREFINYIDYRLVTSVSTFNSWISWLEQFMNDSEFLFTRC